MLFFRLMAVVRTPKEMGKTISEDPDASAVGYADG
jgi:hypothetical protein